MVNPPPEIPKAGKIFFTLSGLGLILLSLIPLWFAVGWGAWHCMNWVFPKPDSWLFILLMLIIGVVPLVPGIMLIRQAYPKGRRKSPDRVGVLQAIVIALSERIREQRGSNRE